MLLITEPHSIKQKMKIKFINLSVKQNLVLPCLPKISFEFRREEKVCLHLLRLRLTTIPFSFIGRGMLIFNCCSLIYLTNRFHFAVRLFSYRSQMTSKCGKNKKVAHEPLGEWVTDVLTTF